MNKKSIKLEILKEQRNFFKSLLNPLIALFVGYVAYSYFREVKDTYNFAAVLVFLLLVCLIGLMYSRFHIDYIKELKNG
jgi:uncharacterized membrane protein YwzB